jgi:hypothetical protein
VGVIAQDIEKVLPEVVSAAPSDNDPTVDLLSVVYSEMIPLAFAGIQELTKKFDEILSEIADIKRTLAAK